MNAIRAPGQSRKRTFPDCGFAIVSQHVVMLNASIALNVALGRAIDRQKVHDCLIAANLGLYISELPHGIDAEVGHNALQLSGGQRQRLAIARALAMDPLLIIADEPLSGADVSIRGQILNLLIDIREERGVAYLMITHDISIARAFADRVAVMQHGTIVETGVAEAVLSRPSHPYTRQLVAAVPVLKAPGITP